MNECRLAERDFGVILMYNIRVWQSFNCDNEMRAEYMKDGTASLTEKSSTNPAISHRQYRKSI